MFVIGFAGKIGSGKDYAAKVFKNTFGPRVVIEKYAYPLQDCVAVLLGFYKEDKSHRRKFDDRFWKENAKYYIIASDDVLMRIAEILSATNKQSVYKAFGVTIEAQLNTIDVYLLLKEHFTEVLPYRQYTPRALMQIFGTDLVRNKIHENTWVALLLTRLSVLPEDSLVVVTDVRFTSPKIYTDYVNGDEVYAIQQLLRGICVYIESTVEDFTVTHSSEHHHTSLKNHSDVVLFNDKTAEFREVVLDCLCMFIPSSFGAGICYRRIKKELATLCANYMQTEGDGRILAERVLGVLDAYH